MMLDALDTVAAYWNSRIDDISALRSYAEQRGLDETYKELNAQRSVMVQDYNLLLALIDDARRREEGEN